MAVKILDSETVNQIAAGEIVERPCGIVKELAENSLDAKADKIEAEFDDGGRFIKIKDNGEGIEREDMKTALIRHATSKIRRAEDLWGVRTYGFRGEALAGLSAVSDLTLISKRRGTPGFRVQSLFGKTGEVLPANAEDGTTVIVQSLFENAPARFKFLKSAVSETARIKTVLKDLALCRHGLSLKILQKGRLLFYWPAQKSFQDRCRQISGKKDLYWTEKERGAYKLTAVLAAPDDVMRGRRGARIFVQNRPVEDRVIYSALTAAYRGLLMRGEHPIAFVKLEGPGDEIDVNVHPAKKEVRFKNSSLIFNLTESGVRDLLKEAPWTKKLTGRSFYQKSSFDENLKFQNRRFQETHFQQQPADCKNQGAADRFSADRPRDTAVLEGFAKQKRDSDRKAQLKAAPSLFSSFPPSPEPSQRAPSQRAPSEQAPSQQAGGPLAALPPSQSTGAPAADAALPDREARGITCGATDGLADGAASAAGQASFGTAGPRSVADAVSAGLGNDESAASALFADSSAPSSGKEASAFSKGRFIEEGFLPLSLQSAAAHCAKARGKAAEGAAARCAEAEDATEAGGAAAMDITAAQSLSGGRRNPAVWSSLQVLAQARLTYLVCQSDKALVFIDQHAAHERVIYERLLDSRRKGSVETQKRLIPFSFEMNDEEEAEALLSLRPELEQTGLVLERLGPLLLAASSSPPILKEQALKEGLQLLAREFIESGARFSFEKQITDVFASMACHSAVRAGQSLSLDEMRDLLKKMDEFPLSGFCPHGRPVFVEYPVSRLERDFGRTV